MATRRSPTATELVPGLRELERGIVATTVDRQHGRARRTARTERAELERRWWRPGREADLSAARARETTADEHLVRLILWAAEEQHAQRPFIGENDLADRTDAQRDRLITRRLTRSQDRDLER